MLTVTRDSGYADKIRKYEVLIDGKQVGEIANGETKSFDVTPGGHTIQLKIDWARSNQIEFTSSNNEDLRFKVSSPLRGINLIKSILFATVLSHKYLILEQLS
jgi:hypothetical protein